MREALDELLVCALLTVMLLPFAVVALAAFTIAMPITSKPYIDGARQAIHDSIVSVFPETRVYWEGER